LKKAISLNKNIADAYYTIGLAYQDMAGKEIAKLDKPDNEKQVNNKETESPEVSENPEEKKLSKSEVLALIVDNLKNSKDYYTQYTDLISNSDEKTKIKEEVKIIDEDIKKYEEKISSSND